jgi:hypothetical protein
MKATVYNKNLKDLANINVKKVEDPDENARISEFFSKISLFAFMQTGLNKTKLNFTNVVDYSDFLDVVESESKKFMTALNTDGMVILDKFYDLFLAQNSTDDKGRFKDYLSDIDYENPSSIKPSIRTALEASISETSADEITELSMTDEYEERALERFGLNSTVENNIFTYDDTNMNRTYYRDLTGNNRDVVFIYNATTKEITSNFKSILNLQTSFAEDASDMSINIPTGTTSFKEGFRKNQDGSPITSEQYDAIKSMWERRIETIKSLIASDINVAFPSTGFGNSNTMPKELFVYLSKRLYEEFNYINPGSVMYDEVVEVIGNLQGISDKEILNQFDLEEDPFKC